MDDICLLAFVKGDERYILLYDVHRRGEALHAVSGWVENDELSLTPSDGATLANRVIKDGEIQDYGSGPGQGNRITRGRGTR